MSLAQGAPKMDSAAKGTSLDEKDPPALPPTAEDIFREKSKSPIFKIGSVIVYAAAVTGNGFALSVFFLFLWDPQIKVSRPSNMSPDYGIFGRYRSDYLVADHLIADQDQGIKALARKSDPEHLPLVPHHRIMSEEFTNNYINNFHGRIVPGSGVVGGFGQAAEVGASYGLPSSAQEDYENNALRTEHHAAAEAADIQSKVHVSNSGSSEDDSNSSSSFGGQKKPSEDVSTMTQHQRPQVIQT